MFAAFTPDAKVATGSHTVTVSSAAMAHICAIHNCGSIDELRRYSLNHKNIPLFPDYSNPELPPTSLTVKLGVQDLMRVAGCNESRVEKFRTYALRNLAVAALCATGTPLPIIMSCQRWTTISQLVRYFDKDPTARQAWIDAHQRVWGYQPDLSVTDCDAFGPMKSTLHLRASRLWCGGLRCTVESVPPPRIVDWGGRALPAWLGPPLSSPLSGQYPAR